jgi:hypothetical protein
LAHSRIDAAHIQEAQNRSGKGYGVLQALAAAAPVMAVGLLLRLATSPGAGVGKQVPVQVLSSIALILRKGT